jgi:hypothetical protein
MGAERHAAAGRDPHVDADTSAHRILLLHDGELAESRVVFEELGLGFEERLGAPGAEDPRVLWRLILATPRHALRLDAEPRLLSMHCVAIVPGPGPAPAALEHCFGVDFVVRADAPPATLRLLILHCLYRGPERRAALRVAVGAPVRFRAGLFRRSGILADLSLSGCLLLSGYPARGGQRLRLFLPAGLGGGPALTLEGRVVRARSAPGDALGSAGISVTFEDPTASQSAQLQAIVAGFVGGPGLRPSLHPAPPAEQGRASLEIDDRRIGPRRDYPHRVIALGEQAARVLIGRDLSLGGMRVDPNPDLRVGNALRIAVHGGGVPLVLAARVARDDGPGGLVLEFEGVLPGMAERLRRILASLPAAATCAAGGAGLVVSEILS